MTLAMIGKSAVRMQFDSRSQKKFDGSKTVMIQN